MIAKARCEKCMRLVPENKLCWLSDIGDKICTDKCFPQYLKDQKKAAKGALSRIAGIKGIERNLSGLHKNKQAELNSLLTKDEIPEQTRKLWYVGVCEPGRDQRVRRELIDLAKEHGIDASQLYRVVLPKHKEWRETRFIYKVLEIESKRELGFVSTEKADHDEAVYRAKKKFEGKGKKKNPVWREVGEVVLEKIGGAPILRNTLTYPGYLIIHMIYNSDTSRVIELMKRKGLWGLLPLQQAITKKDVKTGRAVSKKPNKREEEDRKWWKPTALETEEEAIMLIKEKASRNKETPIESIADVKVGDRVKIVKGQMKGGEGIIKSMESKRKKNPKLTIGIEILGRVTPLTVEAWQVSKL